MSNSHHSRPGNGQFNQASRTAAKSHGGSPLQQQASRQHRSEVQEQNQSHHENMTGKLQHDAAHLAQQHSPQAAPPESSFAGSVLQAIKDNPLPIALAGFGVSVGVATTWYLMSQRPSPVRRATGLAERFLELTASAAKKRTATLLTSPIAIGAAVLTLGAGVTLAILGTRTEKSWLNKSRQQLMETAEGFVHAAIESIEAAAKQMLSSVHDLEPTKAK